MSGCHGDQVPVSLAGLADQLAVRVRQRGALQVAVCVVQEGLAVLRLLLPQLAGRRVQLLLGSLDRSQGQRLRRKMQAERTH